MQFLTFKKYGLLIITLSAFGPYVFFGDIRTDHIVLYSMLIVIICFSFSLYFLKELFRYALMGYFGAIIALIMIVFQPSKVESMQAFLSSLNMFVMYPTCFLVFSCFLYKVDDDYLNRLLYLICKIGVILTFIGLTTFVVQLSWLDYFVKGANQLSSVWSASNALGRKTSIFNQPLEAGVFYSCCLFILIYLLSIKYIKKLVFIVLFFILFIGGAITLSKNFLVLGVIFSLFYLISNGEKRTALIILSIILIALICGMSLIYAEYSKFLIAYEQLYNKAGFIYAMTAGRIGGDSMNSLMYVDFLSHFVTGVQFGYQGSIDSQYLILSFQGGVGALFLYLAILSLLCIENLNASSCEEERKMLLILVVYIVLASFGGGVFTANRANIILILFISILVYRSKRRTLLR